MKKINMSACFVWEEIKLSKLHITRGWIQDFLKGGGWYCGVPDSMDYGPIKLQFENWELGNNVTK